MSFATTALLFFMPGSRDSKAFSVVQDRPEWRDTWPQIRLTHIIHLLATPSSPSAQFYDCYFPTARTWTNVSVQDTQTVDHQQVLLVRCPGAMGHDQNNTVHHFFPAPPAPPPKRGRSSSPEVIKIHDTDETPHFANVKFTL
ncbi:hypothetical protein K438DRAFT_1977267 [Mycena galopus ATCC 62051]|nr:hypothetical protein K438DRAFT_1977267 [Mycena galopus ATCC 62051]